jgi:hypothetical protein
MMRVIVNVGVAFDAESYENAGKLLDRVDAAVKSALDGHGKHEITGFQTRPCKTARFDRIAYAEVPVRDFDDEVGDAPDDRRMLMEERG